MSVLVLLCLLVQSTPAEAELRLWTEQLRDPDPRAQFRARDRLIHAEELPESALRQIEADHPDVARSIRSERAANAELKAFYPGVPYVAVPSEPTPLRTFLDALEDAAGVVTIADSIPDDAAVRLAGGRRTFWEALDALCAAEGWSFDAYDRSVLQLGPARRQAPVSYSGPFRVSLASVRQERRRTGAGVRDTLRLVLNILWLPGVACRGTTGLAAFTRLEDGSGKPLARPDAAIAAVRAAGPIRSYLAETRLEFADLEPISQGHDRLRAVAGWIEVDFPRSAEVLRFAGPFTSPVDRRPLADCQVTLESCARAEGAYVAEFRLTAATPEGLSRLRLSEADVSFELETGKPLTARLIRIRIDENEARFSVTPDSEPTSQVRAVALSWVKETTVKRVPFLFYDVPLR